MEDNLQRLLELGFGPAGEWQLKSGQLSFQLDRYREGKNILYAFVANGQVLYIGKSTRTLYERMNNYKNADSTQRTNIKNYSRIKEDLEHNKRIEIYVFIRNESLIYRGVMVNLAAGLEDNLITMFKPPWNDLGNRS